MVKQRGVIKMNEIEKNKKVLIDMVSVVEKKVGSSETIRDLKNMLKDVKDSSDLTSIISNPIYHPILMKGWELTMKEKHIDLSRFEKNVWEDILEDLPWKKDIQGEPEYLEWKRKKKYIVVVDKDILDNARKKSEIDGIGATVSLGLNLILELSED